MYSIANVISSPDVFVFAAERFVMSLGKALEPYERMQGLMMLPESEVGFPRGCFSDPATV